MKGEKNKKCSKWYEKSYSQLGFKAQRRYPNEELLRFFGRNFFDKKRIDRKNIKVLEVGCGSCSNLWMIAKEGFDAHGIDISQASINLGKKMLRSWGGVKADLRVSDMLKLPYSDNFFNIIVDVFSTNCLNQKDFFSAIEEIRRVLKRNGIFFSYIPSTNSDAFKKYKPSKKIDNLTLDGIKRKSSPFFGNDYPFKFINPQDYKKLLEEKGFGVEYLETVSRTYHYMKENFEFVVIVGIKK